MKKVYRTSILLFLLFYGFSAIVFKAISDLFEKTEFSALIVSLIFILLSSLCIIYFKLEIKFIKNLRPSKEVILLSVVLATLFFLNNYSMVNFSEKNHYSELYKNSNPFFYPFIYFPIRVLGEELLYRGFIQNYINTNILNVYINKYISKGNLLGSSLMLVSHLGFFVIMEVNFALLALLLVIIYSLAIGYIFDRTKNIFLVSIIHLLLNYIHYFIFIMN